MDRGNLEEALEHSFSATRTKKKGLLIQICKFTINLSIQKRRGTNPKKQKTLISSENRRTNTTPKPQEIETKQPVLVQGFPDVTDLSSEGQNTPQGDLFSALDQKIKHGLTPEEQKRLLSSVQKISPATATPLSQTPLQTPRSTVISTPQFRLTTPIRPYTAPIQRSPQSPQIAVKRPVPVYTPITPTQHIKQTVFRSAKKAQSPSVSKTNFHLIPRDC